MNYSSWLAESAQKLKYQNIDSARLDSILLLSYITEKSREHILAHTDNELNPNDLRKLNYLIDLRISGLPIAYLINSKEFYGRSFYIDKSVLVPRPETEEIISLLLKHVTDTQQLELIDIGTGSGILAITAKLQLPNLNVSAVDISDMALEVASKNAAIHSVKIDFKNQNLLDNTKPNSIDIILANLPYVPTNLTVSKEVLSEPNIAVFAENEGLELIYKLADQASLCLKKNGTVFIESLVDQQDHIINYLSKHNFELIDKSGLITVFKKY